MLDTSQADMDKRYHTPQEVAGILGVSVDTVFRKIHAGEIPALRVSERIYRVPVVAFDLWRTGSVPKQRRVGIRQASKRVVIGAGESLPERVQSLRQ